MTQKLELGDKDFKVAVIKMIQQEIVNIPQTHKRIKVSVKKQKIQTEVLELKNTISKM